MTENKRYKKSITLQGEDEIWDMQDDVYFKICGALERLNEQEEKNMQLRNQIKIFELFLDGNNLDIEWDLFCTKEDGCPFTDASCQECVYLGISSGDVE